MIGVRGYGYIHGKSVDIDMDMDGKFRIHGKPAFLRPLAKTVSQNEF